MQFYERALRVYQVDPKQKSYFDIAATLVLLMVLLVMIYPAVDHILKLQQEITTGKKVEADLSQKVSDLTDAQKNLAAIQDDLTYAQKALPVGADFKNYLQTPIEKLASNHKLTIKAIQFTNVPISDPGKDESVKVRDMTYNLTVEGNFTDFSLFLTDLESFIRTTQVTRLDSKRSDPKSPVTFTLEAKVSYLGLPLLTPTNLTTGGTSQ